MWIKRTCFGSNWNGMSFFVGKNDASGEIFNNPKSRRVRSDCNNILQRKTTGAFYGVNPWESQRELEHRWSECRILGHMKHRAVYSREGTMLTVRQLCGIDFNRKRCTIWKGNPLLQANTSLKQFYQYHGVLFSFIINAEDDLLSQRYLVLVLSSFYSAKRHSSDKLRVSEWHLCVVSSLLLMGPGVVVACV